MLYQPLVLLEVHQMQDTGLLLHFQVRWTVTRAVHDEEYVGNIGVFYQSRT